MKRFKLFCCLAALSCLCTLSAQPDTQARVITNIDAGWKFMLGNPKNAQKPGFNDKKWRTLDLPHDWSIEGENLETEPAGGSGGYFPTGIGWYRKHLVLPEFTKESVLTLEFDGVYENSEVWINGHYLGKQPNGYTSFSYNITPYIRKADGRNENIIAVKVDNSIQPNSRWYSGSGIYRHVRLVQTSPLHVEKWGVFNYTLSADSAKAVVHVSTSITNGEATNADITVKQELMDKSGGVVAQVQSPLSITSKGQGSTKQQLTVDKPNLWTLEQPSLYSLRTTLLQNGQIKDQVTNTVGIRTIEYSVDRGFLLNGKQVKMKGVNLHHDAGAVGVAVPERVWERRIEILKSGGCNAIRTAHNPPAPEFLDICDRLGMLVMDEAFDEWARAKVKNGYNLYYNEWWRKDLKAMVMRDRNHPSVVMWSIGNEIPDQGTTEGPQLARDMIALCHEFDPTRLVTSGNDNIAAGKNAASEEFLAAFANDIVGYNYPDRYRIRREVLYAIDKARFPDRRVVATESGGMGGSRAPMPPRAGRMGRRYMSPTASLIDTEQRWKFTLLYDYVIGDFMWTGIDYYGETRWPSRGAGSGYLDNCGFKKDGYYFFKSIWMDEPVLHLNGNWNRTGEEGKVVQVVCFTNCSEVELFVNGKSYGVKTFEFPRRGNTDNWITYAPGKVNTSTADLHLAWDVVYEPGEIKVVGKRDGKEYVDRQVTTGAPATLRLTLDRDAIYAKPSDVVHATVEVLDANGNLCPLADNLISFAVEGADARLIGIESGNMSDLSSTKATSRKAFGGMCLGIIQAKQAGTATIRVTSPGLTSATATVKAQ